MVTNICGGRTIRTKATNQGTVIEPNAKGIGSQEIVKLVIFLANGPDKVFAQKFSNMRRPVHVVEGDRRSANEAKMIVISNEVSGILQPQRWRARDLQKARANQK